uniref:DNA-directed RNA polymerase n=1 Tax=Physcomitrium patens TaxID=3218 RepID=Q8L6F9_PHYPA|nr:RNA polymerase [Physcomitrium patens]
MVAIGVLEPISAVGRTGRRISDVKLVGLRSHQDCAPTFNLGGRVRGGMWRAAVRQLSRQPREGLRGAGNCSSLFWSQSLQSRWTSGSAAAAVGQVHVRAVDKDVNVDARWPLRDTKVGFSRSSSDSVPSSIDQTLDAALHNVVNLPWLFLQGVPAQDVGNFHARPGERPALDYCRTYASAAEAVIDDDDESEEECAPEEPPQSVDFNKAKTAKERAAESRKARWKEKALRMRQFKIETEAWHQAAAEYKELVAEMCKKNLAPNLPATRSLLLGWFEPLRDAIAQEQKDYEERNFREHRAIYGPFLAKLPADMLAVITMHRLMSLLMSDQEHGCVKVVHAALQIGEAVEQEVGIYKLLRSKRKVAKKVKNKVSGDALDDLDTNTDDSIANSVLDSDLKLKLAKEKVKKLVKQQKLRLVGKVVQQANGDEPWGPAIQVKVGSRLLELMLETSVMRSPADQNAQDMTELRPAFKHTLRNYPIKNKNNMNRIYGVIECDPAVMSALDKSVQHMVMPYMPMLVKPRAWTGFYDGGYLHLKSTIMRTHGAKELRDTIISTLRQDMIKIVQALDALGSTQWKINNVVLDVLEQVWKDGGRLADLVDAEDVPLPDKPESDDFEEIRNWRRHTASAKRTNSERHSVRCDTELKLAAARKLRDEEGFFYPHNLDFRGRAYPIHPHLNHLGSDMCRGILQFAEGRALGPTGLRWLKIHLANLYGGKVGKMSFDARVAWVDEVMEKVFDSADRPLDGSRWWLDAEDPFQFLATCLDIRNAIKSGNPETYVSHLPVHQDGSCNGLQHYAALGRDRIGAESVNLVAGDKPADVYSGIAARVREIMERDAQKDPKTSRHAANAKLLLPEIDRKLVKQTVMTSVYGVTFVGARMQIFNRLKERGTIQEQTEMYRAACYAAKTTLNALGEMFKEARCIMSWLGDCAKIIASNGETVKWTTPLGLPVVQPYRKPGRHLVKTSLQVLALRNLDADQPVLVQRQKSAFPPNFVHSLDSTHMMMTALACQEAGLTFAGVHDSYWTHAGDVEQMNSLLREKFVELYSQPVLENLLKSFQERFPTLVFPEVPARGDLDLKEVLRAPYFFN